MFDILLPSTSDEPLYQQIYREIRDQIRNGHIQGGTRLPSVRALQSLLNISKTPIETAYQMLTAEGYLESRPRSGLYAATQYLTSAPEQDRAIASRSPESVHIGNTIDTTVNDWIDFDPTSLDSESFPLSLWSKLWKTALDHHADMIGKYGDAQGEYALRAVIADYLRNSRGVSCSPDQLVVGTGMAYSISLLAKLLKDIQQVAIEDPGYNLVRDQLALNGWGVVPIPVGSSGINVEALERSPAQAVYVTPSHQFPTGSVMPFPERKRLLQWASAVKGYIIEDDYDGECRYIGKPIPSLQGMDGGGTVIYIGTFSKTFTPALRMNYMVLPAHLAKRLADMPHEVLFPPSRIDQWAMQAFIEQGHWYRHLRKVRSLYRRKHQHLIELIQTHLGNQAEITGQHAGLHIQLTIRQERSSQELVRLAAEAGVKVYHFHNMSLQPEASCDYPKVYLGFAGISLSDMETGIRLLRKTWLA